MGTTADKLEYLDGTKSAIKQAIVNKGVAVPDGTTFRQYAEKINNISGMLSSYDRSGVANSFPANWFFSSGVDCVVAVIVSTGSGSTTNISVRDALLAYKGSQMTSDKYTLTLNTDGTTATVQKTGASSPSGTILTIFSAFKY